MMHDDRDSAAFTSGEDWGDADRFYIVPDLYEFWIPPLGEIKPIPEPTSPTVRIRIAPPDSDARLGCARWAP